MKALESRFQELAEAKARAEQAKDDTPRPYDYLVMPNDDGTWFVGVTDSGTQQQESITLRPTVMADLAKAMMSINAVKGVEIGAGFAAAALSGEENADEMRMKDGEVSFLSNAAGGVLGGISSGQDIHASLALKPTSSIQVPGRSVSRDGEAAEVVTTGRHDPCVGIRATPIAEAMLALVLMDHFLRHRGQNAEVNPGGPTIGRG